MRDIRLRGLARTGAEVSNFFQKQFGINPVQEGDDWVVPNNDPGIVAGPPNIITRNRQIPLHPDRFQSIAQELVEIIPIGGLEAYQPDPPSTITLPEGYGRLGDTVDIISYLAILKRDTLRTFFAERALPFMYEQMSSRYVTPITIEANTQQAYISMIKILLLNRRYGIEVTRNLIGVRSSLDGILPTGLECSFYVDAMTRFIPYAFTLTMQKWETTLHFQTDAMWRFPHAPACGIFGEYTNSLNPLGEEIGIINISRLSDMNEPNIWRYLRRCVDSVNNLLRFANDFRNFVDTNDEFDPLKQIQFHSGVHLIFADLMASNFNTNAYHRIVYALNCVSKIANVRKIIGGHVLSELEIFARLFSMSQAEFNRQCLAEIFPTESDLRNALRRVSDTAYENLHEHLRSEEGATGVEETARLRRLKRLRNVVAHGTFLTGEKFDHTFLRSSGTLPEAVGVIPLILVLCMAHDVERFVQYAPSVLPVGQG